MTAVRPSRSKPLFLALKTWFERQLSFSGEALTVEHIRYVLNHGDGMTPSRRHM